MIRLVLFLLGILAVTAGLHWLADRPGNLTLDWQGYVVETSVFRAVILFTMAVALTTLVWSAIRHLWKSPAAIGQIVTRRRERRGLDAISNGMIAIGSGDRSLATRAAVQARKSLPNEPLTHLLRAQAAQLQGDSATARRIFEAMLASPDTEQVGLRGLYLEAEREGEQVAASQFASRALKLNPKLEWPAQSLFDLQCKAKDWDGALDTLASARRHSHIDKALADRRRAVLLTAQAQALEDEHADKAAVLALEAHTLAPDLVPAAAIAGRVLASRGQTPKAAKVLQKTWKLAPHPDLATAYAYARPGDSPSDRLDRVRQLAKLTPGDAESALAVAATAIESRNWAAARDALAPLADKHLTQRVCTLMARVEGDGFQNAGKVREWLARAVHAERDPAWTADGMVADRWAALSPVSGRLDAFEWRVPAEAIDKPEASLITQRMDDLIKLGAAERVPLPAGMAMHREEASTIEVVSVPVTGRRHTADDAETIDDEIPVRPAAARASGDGRVVKAGTATVTPITGSVSGSTAGGRKPLDANAYIATHAPDDPGPHRADEALDAKSVADRYRSIGAKS